MAQRMSPPLSPTGNAYRGRAATRSASPPAQPQSKRDKRRTMLSDKLSDMVASFSNNHFEHYYAQLSALQCDINLVIRADPYRDGPLDDSKEEIDKAVAAARAEICRARPIAPDAEASFNALAGHFYSKFVNDVNTTMEERDSDLTMLFQQHADGLEELHRTNQYKRQLAHDEHALLSKTLRERLIQSVTQKRAKLLRDKEQLDIADSNALLLNPTQFSIGNPASPGGLHGSRKTRHTRGRPGDAAADDSAADGKRKRKAGYDDNDNASPGPSMRIPDLPNGSSNSHRDARAKLLHSQFEAPLYSVDRLFTEKELAFNLNRAHYQTTEYFTKLRNAGLENRLHAAANDLSNNAYANGINGSANGTTNGTAADGEASTDGANGDAVDASADAVPANTIEGDAAVDSPSLAPAQPYHATRAAQRANPVTSLAELASLSSSLSQTQTGVGMGMPMAMAMGNLMPPYSVNISTSASKTNATAPMLGGLPDAEAASDLLLMRKGTDDPNWERLAERCVEKVGLVPAALGNGPARAGDTASVAVSTAPTVHDPANDGPAEAPAMRKTQSGMGMAMSRTNSGFGGESMRRTASAAEFGARSGR